jgi:chromodomain-helicase-DNA-binding protein 4
MQEELDDILRYGAMELFGEEDEEGKARQIHYDDAAIDRFVLCKLADICSAPFFQWIGNHVYQAKLVSICRLLDRAQVMDEEVKAEDEEDNDLLKAFKVRNLN